MTVLNNNNSISKTVLYEDHIHLNAKMAVFGGYYMPISYPDGIKSEYYAVRKEVGLFDVSHMGEFLITGKDAESFLQNITINNVSRLDIGQAQYSAMCYPDGGIVDDMIVYRKSEGFLLVVNASNIDKDLDWINNNNTSKNIKIENLSNQLSLIAIQGPKSREVLNSLIDSDLAMDFYSYEDVMIDGHSIMVSRTGYTGELGFEIYGYSDSIIYLWKELINLGVKPAGLASRDILRMEMAYCLYGSDIDKKTNPIEAGLKWITDCSKKNFIGKDAIQKVLLEGDNRKLVAFIMQERAIPRHGYDILLDSDIIGKVTSGTQSPMLENGIGLAYINNNANKIGDLVSVNIRNKLIPAKIVKPPFIKNTSLHK